MGVCEKIAAHFGREFDLAFSGGQKGVAGIYAYAHSNRIQ
jgi:hypothetical protein